MDRNMLARATSSDDSPTPGYMYGEIAKMTLASFEACKQMEDYLMKRLEKKNANVKRKTLLLIKHVARSGRPEFRRDLCRQLGPIKECLSFSGPPDPLRGDEMYVKVREAAKEALDAVTTSEPLQHQQATNYGGRIEGYGSSMDAGNGVGAPPPSNFSHPPPDGNARSRYEGYGSSPAPQEQPATYMSRVGAMGSAIKEKFAGGNERYVGGNERAAGAALPDAAGNRMAGFGNPNFPQAKTGPTWSEKASSFGRRAGNSLRNIGFKNEMREDLSGMYASNRGATPWTGAGTTEGTYDVPTDLQAQYATQEQHVPQPQPPVQYSESTAGAPPSAWGGGQRGDEAALTAAAGVRGRGEVGGTWGSMASSQPSSQQPSGGAGYYRESPAASYNNNNNMHRGSGVGGASRDGEYERALIQDLCAAGGTRAAPPPEKLESFVRAAATLDTDVIGPNLLDLLDEDKPWQVKCKALAVIEALANDPDCEQHKAYFADVAQDLAYLASNPPLSVQKNARKMLAAFGLEVETDAVDSRRAPRMAPAVQDAVFDGTLQATEPDDDDEYAPPAADAAPALDLLGGYDDSAPVDVVEPVAAAPPLEASGGGLFGDLSLKQPAAPVATNGTNGASAPPPDISLLSVTDSQPAPPPVAPAVDPFAVIDSPAASAELEPPATPAAPPAAAPPPKQSLGGDPFSSLGELGKVSQKAPAPPPATGPAFVASQHATPAYMQQQVLQQQQMQMNAQMVALMQQQQRLAAQQRQLAGAYVQQPVYATPPFPPPQPNPYGQTMPGPNDAPGSAFSFMAADGQKADQADSFSFVSDMMK